MEAEIFRQSIASCISTARDWFLANAKRKSRDDWSMRGGLGDNGLGAVYAFFGQESECFYVGQTTGSVKTRANFETSCHYETEWWEHWHELRFLNITNQTDQLVLETLLILSLSPKHNTKPAARLIHEMYAA
jgi:hypothetical protein